MLNRLFLLKKTDKAKLHLVVDKIQHSLAPKKDQISYIKDLVSINLAMLNVLG